MVKCRIAPTLPRSSAAQSYNVGENVITVPNEIPMTVERAGMSGRTRREQIDTVLRSAVEHQETVVRVRIPVTLYDYSSDNQNRNYTHLRDAAWNIQLPTSQTTPEVIEDLIEVLGQCMVAIAGEGSARVRERLALEWPAPQVDEEVGGTVIPPEEPPC